MRRLALIVKSFTLIEMQSADWIRMLEITPLLETCLSPGAPSACIAVDISYTSLQPEITTVKNRQQIIVLENWSNFC